MTEHGAAPVEGWIHSVESGGTVDGPGLRFVVFTSGCALRCVYCHNPDTMRMKDGVKKQSDELIAEIARYAPFLKRAKGGVTISGGDPLFQPEFTAALLRGCRELGLHTAIDTSGHPAVRATSDLLELVDLVLLDIKSSDSETFKSVTGGGSVEQVFNLARRLDEMKKPVWIRFVVVPGVTDEEENVRGIARFVAGLSNVERVELLPFHQLGNYKWKELGREYTLENTPEAGKEHIERVRQWFADEGVKAV